MDVMRITDTSTRAEVAEAMEARTRRLMARRASLARTWQDRAQRRDLLAEIDDSLDEWLAAGG